MKCSFVISGRMALTLFNVCNGQGNMLSDGILSGSYAFKLLRCNVYYPVTIGHLPESRRLVASPQHLFPSGRILQGLVSNSARRTHEGSVVPQFHKTFTEDINMNI